MLKISLIEGDAVFVEINPTNMSPNENLRGRIVYRKSQWKEDKSTAKEEAGA